MRIADAAVESFRPIVSHRGQSRPQPTEETKAGQIAGGE
jgi:hypothetical protein